MIDRTGVIANLCAKLDLKAEHEHELSKPLQKSNTFLKRKEIQNISPYACFYTSLYFLGCFLKISFNIQYTYVEIFVNAAELSDLALQLRLIHVIHISSDSRVVRWGGACDDNISW